MTDATAKAQLKSIPIPQYSGVTVRNGCRWQFAFRFGNGQLGRRWYLSFELRIIGMRTDCFGL